MKLSVRNHLPRTERLQRKDVLGARSTKRGGDHCEEGLWEGDKIVNLDAVLLSVSRIVSLSKYCASQKGLYGRYCLIAQHERQSYNAVPKQASSRTIFHRTQYLMCATFGRSQIIVFIAMLHFSQFSGSTRFYVFADIVTKYNDRPDGNITRGLGQSEHPVASSSFDRDENSSDHGTK